MNRQDLQLLVDYHYWARDRVLDAVAPLTADQLTRDLGNSFKSIRDTLVHLYEAESVWCARWEGQSPGALPVASDFQDLDAIRTTWIAHERRVRAVVDRFGEDVLRLVEYERNGVRQAQPFGLLLQHVVNHGSYHRGQVTTMLRQVGARPPKAMDLVAFHRELARVEN